MNKKTKVDFKKRYNVEFLEITSKEKEKIHQQVRAIVKNIPFLKKEPVGRDEGAEKE